MKINDELIKNVDSAYQIEREIEALQAELKPLREKIIGKIIEYGTFTIGEHLVIKKHIEEAHIKAYDRRPYDTLTIK